MGTKIKKFEIKAQSNKRSSINPQKGFALIYTNIFTLSLLCILQSCNPLWESELADENFGANQSNQPGTIQTQSNIWSFNTPGNYIFDPNYISVTAGKATLVQVNQTHNSAADFASGTHVGTAYNGAVLTLADAGGCDASSTNCAELDESWTPQWNNILTYWKMNGDWTDSSNNSITGSAEDDETFSTNSKIGSHAGVFDGNLDASSATGITPHSVLAGSLWFYTDTIITPASSCQTLISHRNVSQGNFFALGSCTGCMNNELITYLGGAPCRRTFTQGGSIEVGWHHFAYSWNGTFYDLYLDGVKGSALSATSHGLILSNSDILIAGRNPGASNFFSGKIDDLAIWSISLTEAEIKTIYHRQSALFSGSFESSIINLGANGTWTNLDWVTSLPFGKELPASSGNELSTDYASLVDQTGISGDSDLSDGLVGLWHLNEAVENTAPGGLDFQDSSANGLHAFRDPAGTTTLGGPGILNKAPVFDRSRGIIVGNIPITDMNLSDWSVSAWFKLPSAVTARRGVVSKKEGSFGDFGWSMEIEAGTLRARLDGPSGNIQSASLTRVNDDKWHHGVITFDRDNLVTIYIDGKADRTLSISALAADNISNATPLVIGCKADCTINQFDGYIDEVGTWSRVLDSAEVLELYRRGANRVKFQVRSCDDSACVGEPWIGPDGTSLTYFNELHNCTSINGATGECDGNVQIQSPSLNFSDFVSSPTNNQYFQYRTILESDDEKTACTGGTQTCLPNVSSIEIGPTGRYFAGSPMIVNTTPVAFTSLSAFTETAGGTCIVTYQVSNDGITFYYWTGATWAVAGGVAQSNNAADINTNISSFTGVAGAGSLFWKAFLTSDTSQDCELDELNFSF